MDKLLKFKTDVVEVVIEKRTFEKMRCGSPLVWLRTRTALSKSSFCMWPSAVATKPDNFESSSPTPKNEYSLEREDITKPCWLSLQRWLSYAERSLKYLFFESFLPSCFTPVNELRRAFDETTPDSIAAGGSESRTGWRKALSPVTRFKSETISESGTGLSQVTALFKFSMPTNSVCNEVI